MTIHHLYRCYDVSGRLLYIGSTGNLFQRLGNANHKDWFPSVVTIRLERFLCKDDCLDAERMAIKVERPLHNVTCAARKNKLRHEIQIQLEIKDTAKKRKIKDGGKKA